MRANWRTTSIRIKTVMVSLNVWESKQFQGLYRNSSLKKWQMMHHIMDWNFLKLFEGKVFCQVKPHKGNIKLW